MHKVGKLTCILAALGMGAASSSAFAAGVLNDVNTDLELTAILSYLSLSEVDSEIIYTQNLLKTQPNNASLHFKLSKLHMVNNDYLKAETELNNARTLRLSERQWMLPLGRVYLKRYRYEELLSVLNPSTDWIEDDVWAQEVLVLRGHAYRALAQLEQAKAEYNRVLTVNSHMAEAWYGLASTALLEGDTTSATKAIRQARVEGFHDKVALVELEALNFQARNQMDQGFNSFYAMSKNGNTRLEGLVGLAHLHLLNREFKAFEQVSSNLFLMAPKNPRAMYFAALSSFISDDHRTAETILSDLIEEDPSNRLAYYLLAKVYYEHDNYTLAATVLDKLAGYEPMNPYAQAFMSLVQLKLERADQALKTLAVVNQAWPNDPRFIALVGRSYELKGDLDQALEYYQTAAKYFSDGEQDLTLTFKQFENNPEQHLEYDNSVRIDETLLDSSYLSALVAMNQLDAQSAQRQIEQMPKEKLQQPLIAYTYGQALWQNHQPRQAISYLESVLNSHPKFLQANLTLSDAFLATGQMKQAEYQIKKTMALAPNNARTLMQYAELSSNRNESDQTIAWLQKAIALQPGAPEPSLALIAYYIRQGHHQQAYQLSVQLKDKFPGQLAFVQYHAKLALDMHQYEEAESAYLSLAKDFPGAPTVSMGLAHAYWGQNKLIKSQETLDQILKFDQNYVPALSLKVELAMKQGQYDDAIKTAKHVLDQNPSQKGMFKILGQAFQHKQMYDRALSYYEQFHKHEDSLASVKDVYQARQLMNDPKAIETVETYAKTHADNTHARAYLGEAYMREDKHLEAIMVYERIVIDDHDNLPALNNLALLYTRYDPRRAIDFAQRAHQLASNNPKVLDTYGWVLLQSGQTKEGFQYLKQASREAPRDLDVRYHLGVAKHKLGDINGARDDLQFVVGNQGQSDSMASARQLLRRMELEAHQDTGIRL